MQRRLSASEALFSAPGVLSRLRLDIHVLHKGILLDIAGSQRTAAEDHLVELHIVNRVRRIESRQAGRRVRRWIRAIGRPDAR